MDDAEEIQVSGTTPVIKPGVKNAYQELQGGRLPALEAQMKVAPILSQYLPLELPSSMSVHAVSKWPVEAQKALPTIGEKLMVKHSVTCLRFAREVAVPPTSCIINRTV